MFPWNPIKPRCFANSKSRQKNPGFPAVLPHDLQVTMASLDAKTLCPLGISGEFPWSYGLSWRFLGISKIHGKFMENSWKIHGKFRKHPWKIHGKFRKHPWRYGKMGPGKFMENSWLWNGTSYWNEGFMKIWWGWFFEILNLCAQPLSNYETIWKMGLQGDTPYTNWCRMSHASIAFWGYKGYDMGMGRLILEID